MPPTRAERVTPAETPRRLKVEFYADPSLLVEVNHVAADAPHPNRSETLNRLIRLGLAALTPRPARPPEGVPASS